MTSLISDRSFAHLMPSQDGYVERRRSREDGGAEEPPGGDPKDRRQSPLSLCELTDSGSPLITLDNQKSYTFSLDLSAWWVWIGAGRSDSSARVLIDY